MDGLFTIPTDWPDWLYELPIEDLLLVAKRGQKFAWRAADGSETPLALCPVGDALWKRTVGALRCATSVDYRSTRVESGGGLGGGDCVYDGFLCTSREGHGGVIAAGRILTVNHISENGRRHEFFGAKVPQVLLALTVDEDGMPAGVVRHVGQSLPATLRSLGRRSQMLVLDAVASTGGGDDLSQRLTALMAQNPDLAGS